MENNIIILHPSLDIRELIACVSFRERVVQNGKDLFEDPQLAKRNYFWEMEHPEMRSFSHLGNPFELTETPARPRMPAPCLGEHNEYICTKILGMSDEEFLDLLTKGVFE